MGFETAVLENKQANQKKVTRNVASFDVGFFPPHASEGATGAKPERTFRCSAKSVAIRQKFLRCSKIID
jgi:hypothetical protein